MRFTWLFLTTSVDILLEQNFWNASINANSKSVCVTQTNPRYARTLSFGCIVTSLLKLLDFPLNSPCVEHSDKHQCWGTPWLVKTWVFLAFAPLNTQMNSYSPHRQGRVAWLWLTDTLILMWPLYKRIQHDIVLCFPQFIKLHIDMTYSTCIPDTENSTLHVDGNI